jgi:cyclopropane fatty-acyl-phospholipid synthase-like methyltransferase
MWTEQASRAFLDYGRYFVPERAYQIQAMVDLIPLTEEPFHVLELACGEGLLAEALLKRYPQVIFHGYDGSTTMLKLASERLQAFSKRFDLAHFELSDRVWRTVHWPIQAIVSSLAIHHLDGNQKKQLFIDLFKILEPGGALIMADVILPSSKLGLELAAETWDNIVQQQAMELDSHDQGFQHFRKQQWNLFRYPDPMDKPSGIFEQLQWLTAAGYQDVDVYWVRGGHALYGGWK